MCTWDAENERWIKCLQGGRFGTPEGPACEEAMAMRFDMLINQRDELQAKVRLLQTKVDDLELERQKYAKELQRKTSAHAAQKVVNNALKMKVDILSQEKRDLRSLVESRDRTISHLEEHTVDIPEARPEHVLDWDAIGRIPDQLRGIYDGADYNRATIVNVIDTVEEMLGLATKPARDAIKSDVHPLESWWMEKAKSEVGPLIAKMEEYGGNGRALDLTQIGEALRIAGAKVGGYNSNIQPGEGDTQELGVYFYLVGKFGRWTAALREGRPVSDDTLHDIGIYVRMAQRIREAGGWPT